MFRRLGWIVVSYFTRPLILVLVAGGLLFTAFTWYAKQPTSYEIQYPQPPAPELLVDSMATLEAVRLEERQEEVDAIDLNRLWADMQRPENAADAPSQQPVEISIPGETFFRIFEEFPNLRIVTMSFFGQSTGAEQLVGLRRLEYLAIDGLPPADLSWLRQVEELRWLELTFFKPLEDVEALGELPEVETVVFRSSYEVSDRVLEAMARLPHLKQLVLYFYGGASGVAAPPLTVEGFAALGRSESLETLYVGDAMTQDRGELVALASRALPGLDIEPARVAEQMPVSVRVFPITFLAMAVGFGLAAQFRGPQSRLAPRFVASHALVASVMFAAIVVLGAARLMTDGSDLWTSFTISAAVVAAAICATSIDPTAAPINTWKLLPGNLLRTAIFFGVLGLIILLERDDAATLGRNRPWILGLLGLAAVAAIGVTANGLRRLALSSTRVPWRERGGYGRRRLLQSQFTSGRSLAVARHERRIDSWTSGPQHWTWWNRVRRWQSGNTPFQNVLFMLLFVCGYLPVLVLFRMVLRPGLARWALPVDASELSTPFLIAVIALLLVVTSRVAYAWRARMLTLPLEFLRPYTRRDLQNEMAAAFVLDLVPPALVVATIGSVGMNLNSALGVEWARVPFDFVIVALACLAMTAGLGAVGVVVKRDWLVAALFVAITTLIAAAVGVGTESLVAPNMRLHGLTPQVVEAQLGLVIVAGIVLAGVMRQRFIVMEIGSRG